MLATLATIVVLLTRPGAFSMNPYHSASGSLVPLTGSALVVGVGRFGDPRMPPLAGPSNDGVAVASAVRRLGFKVSVLLDAAASRSMILATAKKAALPGVPLFVHFSGRGVRLSDPTSFGATGVWLITSDTRASSDQSIRESALSEADLHEIAMTGIRAHASQVVFSIDSCFSGGLDLDIGPRVVAITSSGQNEESYEITTSTGRIAGSFSWSLARRLNYLRPRETFASLIAEVRADMQRPSGVALQGDANAEVFDGSGVRSPLDISILRGAGTWRIPVGEANGIGADAVFEIHARSTHIDPKSGRTIEDGDQILGRASPSKIDLEWSTLPVLKSVSTDIALTAHLISTTFTVPGPSIDASAISYRPFLNMLQAAAQKEGVSLTASNSSTLRLTYDHSRLAQFEMLLRGNNPDGVDDFVEVRRGSGEFVDSSNFGSLADMKAFATQLAVQAKRFVMWQTIAALEPASGDLSIRARLIPCEVSGHAGGMEWTRDRPFAGDQSAISMQEGDYFRLMVSVASTRPNEVAYVRVVDLLPDGDANQLFPHDFRQDNESALLADGLFHPLDLANGARSRHTVFRFDRFPVGSREVFKFIASNQPCDLTLLFNRGIAEKVPINSSAALWSVEMRNGSAHARIQHSGWAATSISVRSTFGGDGLRARPNELPIAANARCLSIGAGIAEGTPALNAKVDSDRIAALVGHNVAVRGARRFSSITDLGATKSAVVQGILKLDRECSPEDLQILHYSGRGICGASGEPELLLREGVSDPLKLSDLQDLLSNTPARCQLIILDGCHLGEPIAGRSLKRLFQGNSIKSKNIMFLSAYGEAFEDARGGVLTSAVQDAANDLASDVNGDGYISAVELRAAVQRKVGNRETLASFQLGDDFAVTTLSQPVRAMWRRPLTGSDRQEEQERSDPVANPQITDSPIGNKYAVLIGCSQYDHLGRLPNPIADVELIENVLHTDYGFSCLVLKDPGLNETDRSAHRTATSAISDALLSFAESEGTRIRPEDELIVYYAGHGGVDQYNQGFLLPGDYQKPMLAMNRTCYKLQDLIDSLDQLIPGRILLVTDACYQGAAINQLQNLLPPSQTSLPRWRKMLVSGYFQVPDGTAGDCSPFAKSLASILSRSNGLELRFRKFVERLQDDVEAARPELRVKWATPFAHEFPGRLLNDDTFFVRAPAKPAHP